MNDDPRLLKWLALTERALRAPEEQRAETLREIAEEREDLKRSLDRDPPSAPPSQELACRLLESEKTLVGMTAAFRAEIRTRIGELRKVRSATRGYRPTEENIPAFLSKSI